VDLGAALLILAGVAIVVYLATVIHAATLRTLTDAEVTLHPGERLVLWPRWLIGLIVALLAAWALYRVRRILPPFFLGLLLAYVLNPLVERLRVRGMTRGRAIAVIFGALVLLVLLAASLIIPALAGEVRGLAAAHDTYLGQLQRISVETQAWAMRLGARLGLDHSAMQEGIASLGQRAQEGALRGLQSGLSWLNVSITIFMFLVLAPVVAFWILKEYHVLSRVLLRPLPEARRHVTVDVVGDINRIVGGYLLGMATMIVLVAAYSALVLLLLRVPFALLLGAMTGVLSMIPYFGFPLSMGIIALVMVGTGKSGLAIAVMIALHVLGNVTNDYVVSPRVIGKRIGLHPLVIIFALLAGGELLGFVGMLLAVPAAAILQALLTRFWPEVFAKRYVPPEPALPVPAKSPDPAAPT
jgi:predicted PurR-regulated permease PerM